MDGNESALLLPLERMEITSQVMKMQRYTLGDRQDGGSASEDVLSRPTTMEAQENRSWVRRLEWRFGLERLFGYSDIGRTREESKC